jgi:hypothetical protein
MITTITHHHNHYYDATNTTMTLRTTTDGADGNLNPTDANLNPLALVFLFYYFFLPF